MKKRKQKHLSQMFSGMRFPLHFLPTSSVTRTVTLLLMLVCTLTLVLSASVPSQAQILHSSRYQEDAALTAQPTLDNQVIFTGQTEPGTTASCLVYTYNSRKNQVIIYSSHTVTGDSGLYEIIAPLSLIGVQYVQITVGDESSHYAYERISSKSVEELYSMHLNLVDYLKRHP